MEMLTFHNRNVLKGFIRRLGGAKHPTMGKLIGASRKAVTIGVPGSQRKANAPDVRRGLLRGASY